MSFRRNYSDYTTGARRFVARFPLFNNMLTQAIFWIAAFILLFVIIHFANSALLHSLSLPIEIRLWPNILLATIMGMLYGASLGILDYFFDKEFFRDKSLGKIIFFKSVISLLFLALVFIIVRFFLFDAIVVSSLGRKMLPSSDISDNIWLYFFNIALIYCFFMTLVITFIIQVNKKFGPGVLLPLLLGKYRTPKEENRAFLFMDLKSSTTIAEALGHIRYSTFIRDSFMDINKVLKFYDAEIYQYVGDEIVVSWRIDERVKKIACAKFFFACQKQFESRSDYYLEKYGIVPAFKAGLHMGKVTAVEIGEIKKDIAYHGDTLNTAARIQSMCNHYDKIFLTSAYFSAQSSLEKYFKTEPLGEILLKGKTNPIGVLSIEELI
jgi:adenylate cyclase